MAEIIREITIGGAITQQSVASAAAKKYYTRLQQGYVYEVLDAWLYADCSSNPSGNTTVGYNHTIWYLCDASGNTICSINGAASTHAATITASTAVSQTGTSLGTPSTTYKTINATDAASRLYLTHQSSGEGMGASGLRCVVRLKVMRPATAA